MNNNLDSFLPDTIVPDIRLIINSQEISLSVFFNADCCFRFLDYCNEGFDHRTSFAKAIFYMYKQQMISETDSPQITEQDFISTSEDNLQTIVKYILVQDKGLREEYNKTSGDSSYKKLYLALKAFLDRDRQLLEESFFRATQAINAFNNLSNSFQQAIDRVILSYPELPEYNFVNGFREFTDAFQTVDEDLNNVMQELALEISTTFKNISNALDYSVLQYQSKRDERHNTLQNYGWFYLSELPEDIIDDIYMRRTTLKKEEVDNLVVHYFHEKQYKNLKGMIKSWNMLPYFQCRERVFKEVLRSHLRRDFILSKSLLTIHIEGIITDFVRIKLKCPRRHIRQAILDIHNQLENSDQISFSEYYIFNTILNYIENSFTEQYLYDDPDKASDLSRHKIAHGHSYNIETEVNSLKQFLYLNEIYKLLTILENNS